MKVSELKELLHKTLDLGHNVNVRIKLPGGESVPNHFHLTEVGRVDKKFVDCGGTLRDKNSCLLQIWTANDVDHRLTVSKLFKILELSSMLNIDDLDLEVEYGPETKSQYLLQKAEVLRSEVLLTLTNTKTECLAQDKCGINVLNNCCETGSCC